MIDAPSYTCESYGSNTFEQLGLLPVCVLHDVHFKQLATEKSFKTLGRVGQDTHVG